MQRSERDFITALTNYLAEHHDIAFVFPVGDIEILCLTRHSGAIPSSVGLVMAEPAVVETCFNKFRLCETASQLGIPQSEFCRISEYSELARAVERIGCPCVVKPGHSQTTLEGRKAVILATAADLRKMLPAWPKDNEFLILQKFALGHRHNCHFAADQGQVFAYFEQRVLRTDEKDGTGYGVDGISYSPTANLRRYCTLLAEKLNYSGVGCAQFLVDDQSGETSFLEINPRLDATCALPYYCGYDFPRMAVLHAQYRRGVLPAPPANSSPYPVGKRAISLWRDVEGLAHAVKTQNLDMRESLEWLKSMALTIFHGDFHLTWSWADPLPASYRFLKLVPSAIHHVALKFGLGHRHETVD